MYNQVLDALGITQASAETILILGAVLLGVGALIYLFWHWILIGAGLFVVLTIFSHHVSDTVVEKAKEVIEKKEEILEERKDPEKEVYMEDCISLTHKPELCNDSWSDRKTETIVREADIEVEKPRKKMQQAEVSDGFKPVSSVKLIDTDNEEYKARRAEALKKPGAVIFQDTYR